MAKELFNQAIATIDRAKRLAFGQPSQNGCDNILISTFQDDTRGYLKLGQLSNTYVQIVRTDCAIIGINVKYISGTPNLRIGTTQISDDIIPSTDINTSVRMATSIQCYGNTIFLGIGGTGTLEVTLVFENNIF